MKRKLTDKEVCKIYEKKKLLEQKAFIKKRLPELNREIKDLEKEQLLGQPKEKEKADEIVVKKKKIDTLSLILIFNPLVMSVIVVMLLDYHSTIVVGVFALYLILWLMFISQFALKLVKKLIYK
jgi:hypothetical protein